MTETALPRSASGPVGPARLSSDERLVSRAQRGDDRAMAEIFRRYHQPLYRFCLAILSSPEDAQDALQSTMVKALRALPGEERQIRLKPWLYRIAHNESIDLLRLRRPTVEVDPESLSKGVGPAEAAELGERLRHLVADLGELPKRQRGALVMRELSGLDFEEIGASLGTSPEGARQTIYEARLGLRQMSEGREMACDDVTRAISDGDRRVLRRRDIRAHLRSCEECASFQAEIGKRREDLAALSPLPAVAAAGLLGGILGGGGGGGGASVGAGALGSGAAGTLASSAGLKAAATIVAVAALGTAAADRAGLVHLTHESNRPGSSRSDGAVFPGAPERLRAGGDVSRTSSAGPGRAVPRGGRAQRGSAVGLGSARSRTGEASSTRSSSGTTSTRGAPSSTRDGGLRSHGSQPAHTRGKSAEAGQNGNGNATRGGAHPEHPEHPAKPPRPVRPEHPASGQSPQTPKPAHPSNPAAGGSPSPATESVQHGNSAQGSGKPSGVGSEETLPPGE